MSETITLKDDEIFLVTDTGGEITSGPEGHGLYYQDTRYLSQLELTINGEKPSLLSHNVDYNIASTYHLSSAYRNDWLAGMDKPSEDGTVWNYTLHAMSIIRRQFVRKGLIETLELTNYYPQPMKIDLALRVSADFADIFEVRGLIRKLSGEAAEIEVLKDEGAIAFKSIPFKEGLPDRHLRLQTSLTPTYFETASRISDLNGLNVPEIILHFELNLTPNVPVSLALGVFPEEKQPRDIPAFQQAVTDGQQLFQAWQQACTQLESDNYALARLYGISVLDIRSLMQQTPQGLAITAGLPWYFTLFGRDSLITALQTLSLNPQIAVDTLRVLAQYQAIEDDPWRDSEPGKILHELRVGDLARADEVPHTPYYGSVDSTLLFILCFAEVLRWTGDQSFFTELWPNIERALNWAWQYGQLDDSGYIKYRRRSERGILHQGWKDSDESMGGFSGVRPPQPIALVEVQGYWYDAQIKLAAILRRFGDQEQQVLATRLETEAAQLKQNFNRDFWWAEETFYYQAIDASNQPVRNVTSNIGHCLWSGIVDEAKAAQVAVRLMQPDLLSGWGLRTISQLDPTYNPMSYHNGSVWPHDNALALAGLRRYGCNREALQLINEIFRAAATFPEYRLPELYGGFPRSENGITEKAPAAYPVSCSPQAWAAGTGILLVQVLLGLNVLDDQRLEVAPILPDGVNQLTLRGLTVGSARLDLSFVRDPQTGHISATHTNISEGSTIVIR